MLFSLFISLSIFSQNVNENQIEGIQKEIDKLETKKSGLAPQQVESINAQIIGLEQQKLNLINAIKVQNETKENQISEKQKIINQQNQLNKQLNTGLGIQSFQNQQANLNQIFSNEMMNLSNSMQNIMIADVRKNLSERHNLISGFYNRNQVKLNKIFSLYNQIPVENFNVNLNGFFKCYFITQKKYIYAINSEIISVEDCIVKVENNTVLNLYLDGNKDMELDFPKKSPTESEINNGLVTYFDLEKLETYRLIFLEPYFSLKENETILLRNNVGHIILWSSNKNDEGKLVYVQELSPDKKQLIREVSIRISYAKNEKELLNSVEKYSKTPLSAGNVINYLGEVTSTPYGNIPLHVKTSNDNLKPLVSGEFRFVEIKKYRE